MNVVNLIGRLTKDPELRVTNNGDSVASFTLAVNRPYESADGVEADFPNCVIWGKGAKNVENYCFKGSKVAVEGRLRTRSYENSRGVKIYVTEVVCNRVEFLDTKKKASEEQEKVTDEEFYSKYGFNIDEEDIQF